VLHVNKTDFSKILGELNAWGYNDYELAEQIGIERSKLYRFRKGERKQPYYDEGAAIMEFYKKESRKHKSQ